MSNKKFSRIYNEVKENINVALNDISEIKIKNKKGNEHIESLVSKLSEISKQFSNEINYLETNSEWDKFTIAFFGETNAGKSTILESLRILFEEKTRQEKIRTNTISVSELEKSFSNETSDLLSKLNRMYNQYNANSKIVAEDVSNLKIAFKNEYKALEKLNRSLSEKYSSLKEATDSLKKEHRSLNEDYRSLNDDYHLLERQRKLLKRTVVFLYAGIFVLLSLIVTTIIYPGLFDHLRIIFSYLFSERL